MAKKANIFDVARKVGVSPTTVSHALSGHGRVSQAVREKVIQAAAELGYHPSFTARSLVSQKTRMIGVLMAEISNPYFARLTEVLADELSQRGYRMVLSVIGRDRALGVQYLHQFAAGLVDGVINVVQSIGPEHTAQACPHIPVVHYCQQCAATPVLIDFGTPMLQLLESLWKMGHRQIAFISAGMLAPEFLLDGRLVAFQRFMEQHGRAPAELLLAHGVNRMSSGAKLAGDLYRSGATAIVCHNDVTASGVLRWAYEQKIRVPDDLSVTGFDDTDLAQQLTPPLTTAHIPVDQVARHVVEALLRLIQGHGPSPQQRVVPKLVLRSSTAPPRSAEKSRPGANASCGSAGLAGPGATGSTAPA